MTRTAGPSTAVFAGGGGFPLALADAIVAGGGRAVLFRVAGEADDAPVPHPVHAIRYGEIGRLLKLLSLEGCDRAVLAGRIVRRPRVSDLVPDFGAIRLMPRLARVLTGGDDSLLRGVAALFEEHGVRIVGPLDVAPGLGMPSGLVCGRLDGEAQADLEAAGRAARAIGDLDIGQAAVAIDGRAVALEGVEGTDGMLDRVAVLRRDGRLPKRGGVLVKLMKRGQDSRLDLPTVGPETAARAAQAGLAGVGAEAGRAILLDPDGTRAAFAAHGLFLAGIAAHADG